MLGLFLTLLGLLYYSTISRKAVSRAGKLSAAHACDFLMLTRYSVVENSESGRLIEMPL